MSERAGGLNLPSLRERLPHGPHSEIFGVFWPENIFAPEITSLPALVDRAAKALAGAKTAAEVLDARDVAGIAYDAAKKAARMLKARQAADELIAAAYRAEADAHEIQAQAKRRLADEYDAAQERGDVAKRGGERSGKEHSPLAPSAADIGLSRKDIHEARLIRDAEEKDPGIVRRTLDEALAAGEEPTKAKIRRAVERVAKKLRRPRGHHWRFFHDARRPQW